MQVGAGVGDERRPGCLGLLVGSNPLPNCLAGVALRAPRVVLLYSGETLEPCERLEAAFRAHGIEVRKHVIHEPTNPRVIREVCAALREVDHLHYSGGTKPMAPHARMALNIKEHQASYLDERHGLLRFDDDYSVSLRDLDLGLTLNRILELHGIKRAEQGDAVPDGPTEQDVEALAGRVLREPKTAETLYRTFRDNGKIRSLTEAGGQPWVPGELGLSLTVPRVPEDDWARARYEAWVEFLTGGWLEQWTASQVRRLVDETYAVEVGVHWQRIGSEPAQFEIDVGLVRRQRLYVLSRTTDSKKAQCKSKLFEVAMRARQMGGDLARSGLMCLLDGSDANGAFIEQLCGDIASLWDAPNVPKAFGLADLREWAGVAGEPNLTTLPDWLES